MTDFLKTGFVKYVFASRRNSLPERALKHWRCHTHARITATELNFWVKLSCNERALISQNCCGGTVIHWRANRTMAPASINPYPNEWLTAIRWPLLAVRTTMCCMSRHVRFRFASSTKAQIPAASGAAADVPVWLGVHEWCKSVVTIYCKSSTAVSRS